MREEERGRYAVFFYYVMAKMCLSVFGFCNFELTYKVLTLKTKKET